MSWISLVYQTIFGESNDPVEDAKLVRPFAILAKSTTYLEFKVMSELLFVPIQITL